MLDLKEMLIGYSVRLRYVNRFSTCRILNPETVAEHSFFVAYYALLLARWCTAQISVHCLPLNQEKLLARALFHDIDEAVTGDVPRPFKYSDDDLKHKLDIVAAKGVKKITSKLWGESPIGHGMFEDWKDAKDDTLEGRILEFADFLSVLSYIYEEIRASNTIMQEHIAGMQEYYDKFTKSEFDFLRPLIEDAKTILFEEILVNGNGTK